MGLNRAIVFIAISFALTASCSSRLVTNTTNFDPARGLEPDDYRHMGEVGYQRPASSDPLTPPPVPELKVEPPEISLQARGPSEPPIPDLAEIIASPKPPKIGTTKVVSVSVTDDVPLKDILIELARLADVDVEIDSSITGGITFRAKDRPFNEVIDRISAMAGLRYSMNNNVLRIERDVPYIQTYALDMLNIDRASTGNIGTGGTGKGSSSSSITAASKSDFWDKFQESIGQILGYKPALLGSNVGGGSGGPEPFYSLNRQAGTLTFSGTENQHNILRQFLKSIESNVAAQVLIEAKIVEVSLNDSYQTGIDWTKIGGNSISFTTGLTSVAAVNASIAPGTITVLKNDILGSGVDLSAVVTLLQEFGTTRALSSPRLNAMNNQQAVLSFVENLVYFDVKVDVTDAVAGTGGSSGTPAKVQVSSTPKEAPVGIVLTLQPSINTSANEITLNVRPTLSRVTKFIADPGFEVSKANAAAQLPAGSPVIATLNSVSSTIPQLEVRELDSVLKVASGQVMVIGGLLEDSFTSENAEVPGISEVPVVGQLFKSVNKVAKKKELVIFLRATIVPTSGNSQPADAALYNKFIPDARPLKF